MVAGLERQGERMGRTTHGSNVTGVGWILIKWPMAASSQRPTRGSCPIGHSTTGPSSTTRITPGRAWSLVLVAPILATGGVGRVGEVGRQPRHGQDMVPCPLVSHAEDAQIRARMDRPNVWAPTDAQRPRFKVLGTLHHCCCHEQAEVAATGISHPLESPHATTCNGCLSPV